MSSADDVWYDESAGPLVRPYAMTGGRTRATGANLDLISVIVTSGSEVDSFDLSPEHSAILAMCRRPLSVAEIAAHMDIPTGVVKVLLADLAERKAVVVRAPMSRSRQSNRRVLKAVINGIRAL